MKRDRFIRLKEQILWQLVRIGVFATKMLPERLWFHIREKSTIVCRMDYERYPIYMVVDSWIEKYVRLHSAEKEPSTVEWIESKFRPNDVFYDIGANVGAYSFVAFRFLKGKIKIYAFEPGFMNFPQLCRNIQLNSSEKAIIPIQVALSDQTSIVPFHYQNLTSGGALHALGVPIDQRGKMFQPVFSLPTLSYSLDDFVRQFGLPVPNHIKIDVDGREYQILKGAGEILSRDELRSILLEVDEGQEDAGKIRGLLNENGWVMKRHLNENTLYVRK